MSPKICNRCLPVEESIPKLFQPVLFPDYGPMHFLEEPSHPYIVPLVERTIVSLPHPFGKLLQGEFGLLQADCGFTLCTALVWRIVTLIICIIIHVENLRQWGQVHNHCKICFPRFPRQQESFRWEANGRSPRCAGRRSWWRKRARRCWWVDWIVSRRSWRHSGCTWRWRPLSWELLLVKDLRLAITTLVEVIFLPLWPITCISLAFASGWLRTVVCHVEYRMVLKQRSTSK